MRESNNFLLMTLLLTTFFIGKTFLVFEELSEWPIFMGVLINVYSFTCFSCRHMFTILF